MALDEAILEAAASGDSPPTLRLYAWAPPCLSLGSAQPISQVDLERIAASGWDIVRRPTGGRAILHADELTYSIAAPADHPHFQGGVLQGYKYISHGLIEALSLLGLEVELQPEVNLTEEQRTQPVCFQMPSSYEITVQGKKLVGSAQLRRVGGVLQHGSLPLNGDIGRITEVLHFDDEAQRQQAHREVHRHASTIESCLGVTISWDKVSEAMVNGFTAALGMQLQPAPPSQGETDRANELLRDRYANRSWTERV